MAEIDLALLLEQRREELNVIFALLESVSGKPSFETELWRVLIERRQNLNEAIVAVSRLEKQHG